VIPVTEPLKGIRTATALVVATAPVTVMASVDGANAAVDILILYLI
jgi:hypothetical protein